MEKYLEELVFITPDNLFQEIRLEKQKMQLIENLACENKMVIKNLLDHILNRNAHRFLSYCNNDGLSIWIDKIEKKKEVFIRICSDIRFLDKKVKWICDYQELFVHEFSQNDYSKSEINGDGICLGLVCRLAFNTILYPDKSVEELKITSVLSEDRFCQAFTSLNSKMLWSDQEYVKELYEKDDKIGLLNLSNSELPRKSNKNIKRNYIYNLMDIKENQFISDLLRGRFIQSRGGVILGRDKHATFLCVDEAQHRYFFFDPNYGTLQFRKKEHENLRQLIERMLTCYNELYEAFYDSKSNTMVISLMIEKEISS